MLDWINRNIEGAGLVAFILGFLFMYGIYQITMEGETRHQYVIEHNLVKIEGYIKAEDLKNIHLQTIKEN